MIHMSEVVTVPPAWRDAAHLLRLAVASEELARASAASQDANGTVRALMAASRAARRAAARLGQAAATVDGVGRVVRPNENEKERTR